MVVYNWQPFSRGGYVWQDESNTHAATARPLTVSSLSGCSLDELKALCRAAGVPTSGRKKAALVKTLADAQALLRLKKRPVACVGVSVQLTGAHAPAPTPAAVDAAMIAAGVDARGCLRHGLLAGHVHLGRAGNLEAAYVLHSAPCVRCARVLTVAVCDATAAAEAGLACAGCGARNYLCGACAPRSERAFRACAAPCAGCAADDAETPWHETAALWAEDPCARVREPTALAARSPDEAVGARAVDSATSPAAPAASPPPALARADGAPAAEAEPWWVGVAAGWTVADGALLQLALEPLLPDFEAFAAAAEPPPTRRPPTLPPILSSAPSSADRDAMDIETWWRDVVADSADASADADARSAAAAIDASPLQAADRHDGHVRSALRGRCLFDLDSDGAEADDAPASAADAARSAPTDPALTERNRFPPKFDSRAFSQQPARDAPPPPPPARAQGCGAATRPAGGRAGKGVVARANARPVARARASRAAAPAMARAPRPAPRADATSPQLLAVFPADVSVEPPSTAPRASGDDAAGASTHRALHAVAVSSDPQLQSGGSAENAQTPPKLPATPHASPPAAPRRPLSTFGRARDGYVEARRAVPSTLRSASPPARAQSPPRRMPASPVLSAICDVTSVTPPRAARALPPAPPPTPATASPRRSSGSERWWALAFAAAAGYDTGETSCTTSRAAPALRIAPRVEQPPAAARPAGLCAPVAAPGSAPNVSSAYVARSLQRQRSPRRSPIKPMAPRRGAGAAVAAAAAALPARPAHAVMKRRRTAGGAHAAADEVSAA